MNETLFSSYVMRLPSNANVSFLVKAPKQPSNLISYHADLLMPPASTLKVVTALAMRLTFTESYTLTTKLEVMGNHVILRFAGDPYLNDDHIAKLLMAYKKQYGAKIKGDLLLDASILDGPQWAQGITWENLSACYSAPSTALTLNQNCVWGRLNSHVPVGKVAKVHLATGQPMTAASTAKVVTEEEYHKMACSLDASLGHQNHYDISGCMVQTEKPISLRFAVQAPESYAKKRLAGLLKDANIKLAGTVKVQKVKPGKVIASHDSPPLREMLKDMLEESNNLTSDLFFKLMGRRYFNQAGNFANGAKAVKAILKERANIDLSSAALADGSGLSRNNRIEARQIMQILEYIYLHDDQLNLISMLPVSGQTGSLQYRPSVADSTLSGRVKAKTGYIYATHNLVGFLETQSGKPLMFVQMVTDYMPADERKDNLSRKDMRINDFEQAIYTDLVKERVSLKQFIKPQIRTRG